MSAHNFRLPGSSFRSGTSGSKRKRKEEKENRREIYLIPEFKQTLRIDDLLGTVDNLDASSEIKFHSFQFKDLTLSRVKDGSDAEGNGGNLLSIENYLIGRRKGRESEESAFTALATIRWGTHLCFSLEVDTELVEKLCKNLKNPSISATVYIEGMEWEKVYQLPLFETLPDSNDLKQRFANLQKMIRFETGYKDSRVDLSELLNSTRNIPEESEDDAEDPKKIVLRMHKPIDWDLQSNKSALDRFWDGVPLSLIRKVAADPNENKTLTFIWWIGFSFENDGKVPFAKFKLSPNSIGKGLFGLNGTKDFTIIAKNEVKIKCHRIVLMVHSAPFRSIFSPESETSEGQTDKIEMKENSADGLRRFIRFLYGFEINQTSLTPEVAVELLLLSSKYEVKTLEGFLKEFLMKSKDWFNVDALLELYFGVENIPCLDELRSHCLIELAKLPEGSFNDCEYFKKLSFQESTTFLCKLLEWR